MVTRIAKLGYVTTVITALFITPSYARAQSVAVRAGFVQSPVQLYGGLQFETPPLRRRVSLRPGVDIGSGQGAETFTGNLDVIIRLGSYQEPLRFYFGGGPSINAYRFHNTYLREWSAEAGGNVIIGLEHERRVFVEATIGFSGSPGSKLSVGYRFGG